MRRVFGIILVSCLLFGCGKEEQKQLAKPEDLNAPGMLIGVPQGAAAMTVAEQRFDQATIRYYGALIDGYTAVQNRKLDAFVFDRQNLLYVCRTNPELAVLPQGLTDEHIVVGMPKSHTALAAEVNAFIARYLADGTYQEMYQRWVQGEHPQMPDIPTPQNPTRKLTVAAEGLNEPMNYFKADGTLTGFDIEFAKRLALALNAELAFVSADFGGMIAATEAGKVDLMITNLNATPERAEQLLLSDPYLITDIAVLIHRDRLAEMPIQHIREMAGRKAAYPVGSSFVELTEPYVQGIEWLAFNDFPSCLQAVLAGKVDGTMADEPVARLAAATYPEELSLAHLYADDCYGFAFQKGSPLAKQVSDIIRKLKEAGELERLRKKWCEGRPEKKVLDAYTFSGKNGHLVYATDPTLEPMVYVGPGGEVTGLEIDLVRRIAFELGKTVEVVQVTFSALIETLLSKRVDMIGSAVSITEERKQRVDFSESHYQGGLALITRKQGKGQAIASLNELSGKRIGVLSGTTMDMAAKARIQHAHIVYFNAFADQPIALNANKIDAFLMEEPMARLVCARQPHLTTLKEPLSTFEYAFIFPPCEEALCAAFSKEIERMLADGTAQALQTKWFDHPNTKKTMPQPPTSPQGTLRYATVPELAPFTYLEDGNLVGYDIEMATLAAHALGYTLEPMICDWKSYLEAVASGKVQFGVACTAITEERRQRMRFSTPNYAGGLVAVVASAPPPKASSETFLSAVLSSFERTFLREGRWRLILDGLKVTVIITLFAALLGTLLAFGVCALRRSASPFLATLGKGYIALVQGMPILVILMILYYIVFASLDVSAVLIAILGFGLNFAAYVGEMFRTGIDSIPKGQSEAAAALGFRRFAAFRKVIFPQVLLRILPIYRGEFINMLKMTSIVGYIAIQDLTKMSDIIRSRTYEAFFPLIATALIYFAVAHLLASVLVWLEKRLNPLARRAKTRKGGAQ